jgi:starch synthase
MLMAFITGASRLRSPRPSTLGNRFIRRDLIQSLYLASHRLNNRAITSYFDKLSTRYIGRSSHRYAVESEAFLYYRTTGLDPASKIKKLGVPVQCIMEEVNTHVEDCIAIIEDECKRCGVDPSNLRNPDHYLRLRCYEISDHILCPSQYVYNSFRIRGFPESKLIVNNFGVDINTKNIANRKETPIDKNGVFRILFVGQIQIRKGLRYLIKAFEMLRYSRKELMIVGPKVSPTGLETISIPENVVFTGPLHGSALAKAYSDASVFVLPSLEEGLALVLAEAISYGLPVIATTSSGAEDIISNEINGYIIPPRDHLAILDRLLRCLDERCPIQKDSIQRTGQSFVDWKNSSRLLVDKINAKRVNAY